MILETERLILRLFADSDAEDLYAYANVKYPFSTPTQ